MSKSTVKETLPNQIMPASSKEQKKEKKEAK
jgi:hypothetical protein